MLPAEWPTATCGDRMAWFALRSTLLTFIAVIAGVHAASASNPGDSQTFPAGAPAPWLIAPSKLL